jgi:hypothetical protein
MPPRFATLFVAVGVLTLAADGAPGQKTGDQKGRDQVATCAKIEGALLQQVKDGEFKLLKSGDLIAPHTLLVGFPKAELVSICGKVKIDLLLYLGDKLPIREAAIMLNDSPELNADITLNRGIVALQGTGAKGDTLIRIRGGEQKWLITLKDPDSAVIVARFGWQVAGVKNLKTGPDKKLVDNPQMHLGVLVVKGHVAVDTGTNIYSMNAPPGPALITWDSVKGLDVQNLKELPEEVAKFKAIEEMAYKPIAGIVNKLVAGDINKGLDELINSGDPDKQRVALAAMAARDDLPRLVAALENPKSQNARERAAFVLRYWISRDKGQLTKLFDFLTHEKKYSPTEGRGIILMLKGFDEDDQREPITYQLLIEALAHRPLAMREMAHWHLVRMAPAGKTIPYDAAADDASRHKAAEAWRQLIPEGKLPPAVKLKAEAVK